MNVSITGSINNDGTLNFHHALDDADDVINIKGNYYAFNNAQIVIDVNPHNKSSDLMLVDGDVAGTTKVTIYRITDGTTTDLIMFVDAPNDDASTGAYFKVFRVIGEAQDLTDQWKIVHKNNAWHVTSANTQISADDGYGSSNLGNLDIDNPLYVTLPHPNQPTEPDDDADVDTGTDTDTDVEIEPDNDVDTDTGDDSGSDVDIGTSSGSNSDSNKGKIKLYSETLVYMSLPRIGLEQTKDLVRIVSNKVASSKIMSGKCGMSECNYNGKNLYDA